jgi:uncharacterized protein (UPF0333 family)
MSPKSCPGEGFLRDERGLGLVDSPFMILLATILIAFVTVMGIALASTLAEAQNRAVAVDAAEKIYNAADLLSAGAPDSTRTIWAKIPNGYGIRFDGNITLTDKNGVVGVPMHIKGVVIVGGDLSSAGKYHLLLEYKTDKAKPTIMITEI